MPAGIRAPSISCKAFFDHDAYIPHGGMFYTEENPIFKQTPYGNWKHSCLEDALEKIEQIKRVPFGTLRILAPRVGLEPTTLRLTAECSAIELLRLIESGDDLLSRAVASQVPSAC